MNDFGKDIVAFHLVSMALIVLVIGYAGYNAILLADTVFGILR